MQGLYSVSRMKKKSLIYYLLPVFIWAGLAACGGDKASDQGRTYQVTGRVVADSALLQADSAWLSNLVLFADNHSSMRADTIVLDADLSFDCQLGTVGFDELYLCSDAGELCRFYATEGMEVEILLEQKEGGFVPTFSRTNTDSINPWLQAMDRRLDVKSEPQRHNVMDSLVALPDSSLRTTLLLRDHLMQFQDSVYVRRLLGGMAASAKPEWLMQSIEHILNVKSREKSNNRRLSHASLQVLNDSVPFDMSTSRTDYLLLCFWADFSEASVDSLKTLSSLLKKDYAEKRVRLVTCCLHAPDSTWWKQQVSDLEGQHTWLQGGMSDPRIVSWGVPGAPFLILADMYNNQTQRNVWGESLRKALDRLPKRLNQK